MNVVDKNSANGNTQAEPVAAPVKSPGGSEAPAAEVKEPYIPDKKKASRQDQWGIIVGGSALAAVIAVLALTRTTSTKPTTSVASANRQATSQSASSKDSPYGSTTPVNNVQPNPEPASDGSKISAENIAKTAKPRLEGAPSTPANLGGIAPFPNATSWQPPAYQPTQPIEKLEGAESKAEREAMDKPSLVFVRNHVSASQGASATGGSRLGVVDLGLGLPPGTRLRAHLESAVNTAVKTPVLAVVEYNYERDGELLIPAGAKVVGHLESADQSGYIGIRFDTLMMPDGSTEKMEAAATDLNLRPLKGKVEGKNTGKNLLVRSLQGVGETLATIVGQGNLNQPLSEEDLLRGRVANNIGEASDEEVERLAITERVVVSLPAGTEIYVVLEKETKEPAATPSSRQTKANATATNEEQLRQLLQLQRELNQAAGPANASQ